VVVVSVVVGVVLGSRWRDGQRGGDLVGDQLAARQAKPDADQAGRPTASLTPAELERRLRELLVRRKKIQAIKLLREHTRVGLKEAKDAVERVEVGQPLWVQGWAPSAGIPRLAAPNLDQVRALKRQGKLIQAIKMYRELTGAGLKEAKDAVESL
jgi:ribosomal protein L7/L12